MTSTIHPDLGLLQPHFKTPSSSAESPELRKTIDVLKLQPHIEGGYFVETDRDALRVPNPFRQAAQLPTNTSNDTTFFSATGAVSADLSNKLSDVDKAAEQAAKAEQDSTRSASTTIHYLITPAYPLGAFHRNRGRTVHTLHSGRGRYVIIHADGVAAPEFPNGYGNTDFVQEGQIWVPGKKARVETFVVGHDLMKGEKLQWIVDGGKYKSSYLLPDKEGGEESGGLLISETVVPGFEFADHDFMRAERLEALVTKEQAQEMKWMLRRDK